MADIPNLTFWLFIGLFTVFAVTCVIIAVIVRNNASKVTNPPLFNPYCVGISCPGQTGTSTFFFERPDGSYVTRNYCVDNAPTYKQLTSITRCSQNQDTPEYLFWHTNSRINNYANFYETYVNTCGPNWTYANIQTDLPVLPANFADNVDICLNT